VDVLINYLDKFGPELLVIQFGFLVILSTLFLWLWFSNRRKYHNLKHVIPANVVKNYLDSIIQNSTALKSSLFRGGGLDLDHIPSVKPLGELGGDDHVALSGAPSAKIMEELAEKKALIAALEAQLQSAKSGAAEFETKAKSHHRDLTVALEKIAELEAQLQKNGGPVQPASGNDTKLKAELAEVTKERDDLLERLKEFEVIADDLANLKRLQQENDQLRKSLGAGAGSIAKEAAAPVSAKAEVSELLEEVSDAVAESEPTDTSALEQFLSAEEMTPEEKEMLEAMQAEVSAGSEEKKEEKPLANDDLLSEFEKMLG
jgi:hypothetical protein